MPEGGASFRQLSPLTLRVVGIDYRAIPLPGQYEFEAYPYAQPTAAMSCVSRSGTAALIGFDEFTSPSTPPKRYRKKTCSGGWRFATWLNCPPVTPECAGNTTTHSDYAGYFEYNAITGALTSTGAYTGQFGCNGAMFSGSLTTAGCTSPEDCSWSLFVSQTLRQNGDKGACCPSTPPTFATVVYANQADSLSVEDTETDAIARASVTTGSSCLAATEARGAGDFSFVFTTVAYDILCSSLLRNRRYRLTYDLLTEDYGGGNAVIEPITFLFRADATTNHFVGLLVAASGKQISIVNIQLEALSSMRSALFGDGIQSGENHAFREIAPFTPRVVGIDYIAVPLPGNGNEGYYTYEDVPPMPPIPPTPPDDDYMLLPPLVESSGIAYTDEAEAQAVLDDPEKVSNCVGFLDGVTPGVTFVTTGGSSFAWNTSVDAGFIPLSVFFGALHAQAGDTLTGTWGNNIFSPGGFIIYDNDGNQIQEIIEPSGVGVSDPLPYTGKYIVRLNPVGGFGVMSLSATVVSSGVMTTLPVRALYDCGNPDPCSLDC